MHQPVPDRTPLLTEIWRRVLQKPSISAADNFFDLGGEPSHAAKIFAEIADACGRVLPPATICMAPTITDVAAILEQPIPFRIPPLVQLKTGAEWPPAFIAHGLGSNVLDLIRLTRLIRTERPIFGVQAKGINGSDEPFDRIEDMARSSLEAMKQVQPRGPYFLIGYSLGGLVMEEIAQQLSQENEQIGLLAMIDSYPYRSQLSFGQHVHVLAKVARHHLSTMRRLPVASALSYVSRIVTKPMPASHNRGAGVQAPSPPMKLFDAQVRRMLEKGKRAWMSYRPRFYKGKIKFLRAETSFFLPDNPIPIWGRVAEGIEVETVPGDHYELLMTHSELVASALSRYLQEASRQL